MTQDSEYFGRLTAVESQLDWILGEDETRLIPTSDDRVVVPLGLLEDLVELVRDLNDIASAELGFGGSIG